MPGRDQTGPMRDGPMTGRGMGICASDAAPGIGGMGLGWGRGGHGRRNGFRATGLARRQRTQADTPITEEQERGLLEAQAAQLKQSLADVRGRLDELGDEPQS